MTYFFATSALVVAAIGIFERKVNLRCRDGAQGHILLFAIALILGTFAVNDFNAQSLRRSTEVARGKDGCVVGRHAQLVIAGLRTDSDLPAWLCAADKT